MLKNIEVLYHSSIRIEEGNVIYIDPFKIESSYSDADIIFITHDHYDHFSEDDIDVIRKNSTVIIVPQGMKDKALRSGFKEDYIIAVEPGKSYNIGDIMFETVPAYNINKVFHPKENGWVGYVLEIKGVRYYIAGDTDKGEENSKVECDVAFVPVGGTYTMDAKEAAELVNEIKPKIAVPIHYGSIVGTKKDAIDFVDLLSKDIEGRILMK